MIVRYCLLWIVYSWIFRLILFHFYFFGNPCASLIWKESSNIAVVDSAIVDTNEQFLCHLTFHLKIVVLVVSDKINWRAGHSLGSLGEVLDHIVFGAKDGVHVSVQLACLCDAIWWLTFTWVSCDLNKSCLRLIVDIKHWVVLWFVKVRQTIFDSVFNLILFDEANGQVISTIISRFLHVTWVNFNFCDCVFLEVLFSIDAS
jgi:hypothetical protein